MGGYYLFFFGGDFSKKSIKTAVLEDGHPPGALVLTKLIEWYRFGVGDEKSLLAILVALSSEQINGQRARTSRQSMRERVPPLQNSKAR